MSAVVSGNGLTEDEETEEGEEAVLVEGGSSIVCNR